MACEKIVFVTVALLLAVCLAAPAEQNLEEKQDLVASEKEDLQTAASHWGGHLGGWGGHYGGYGGYGFYPHYGSYGYGWPGYGYGYGYGWPYGGGYFGNHGYWW